MPLTPVTPTSGTLVSVAPDQAGTGLVPSTSLNPDVTLSPSGTRTGMLPIQARSGGVLTPIAPDQE